MLLLKLILILMIWYLCVNRFLHWWDNGFKMKHLEENRMGYFTHLWGAWKMIGRMLIVLFKMIVHSIVPFLFEDTGWKRLGK